MESELTGRELDRAIAEKVMGWRLVNYGGDPDEDFQERPATTPEDYEDAANNDGWMWDGWEGDAEAWEWQPSKNIAQAYAMEAAIPEEKRQAYVAALCEIIGVVDDTHCWSEVWALVHATPAERCRAALRAAGRENK